MVASACMGQLDTPPSSAISPLRLDPTKLLCIRRLLPRKGAGPGKGERSANKDSQLSLDRGDSLLYRTHCPHLHLHVTVGVRGVSRRERGNLAHAGGLTRLHELVELQEGRCGWERVQYVLVPRVGRPRGRWTSASCVPESGEASGGNRGPRRCRGSASFSYRSSALRESKKGAVMVARGSKPAKLESRLPPRRRPSLLSD